MNMQLILTEDVPKLGKSGELVSVKPGFGRNYLLPRGLALQADAKNMARLDHDKKKIASKQMKLRAGAEGLKAAIENAKIKITMRVGEQNKMFGSVTARNLEHELASRNIEIDHRHIVLEEPIRAIGSFEVPVKLHSDVVATLKFEVVAEETASA